MPLHETGGWAMRRWRILLAVFALTLVIVGVAANSVYGVKRIGKMYPVQGVFVAYCTDKNEPPPAPPPDCKFTQSSTTWTNIPGATYTFTIPADEVFTNQAAIFARFSGQTRCTGGPGSCVVRMQLKLADGTTIRNMKPDPYPNGIGLHFDSTSSEGFEAHSVEQVYPDHLGAGTYTVTAQAAIQANAGAPNPTFRFVGWTLTTEVAFTEYV
jgi:hypothetical protein